MTAAPQAAQTQIEGLVIERDALLARVAELEKRTTHNAVYDATKQVVGLQTQVSGLVLERDALRNAHDQRQDAERNLLAECRRTILEEQQSTGRTLAGLQLAVDRAYKAFDPR